MTILHYTEATGGLPNSGRLSGTNGDLVGILDIALVAAGWSIAFTSGNSRVYRQGGGNLNYWYVADDSAISGAATLVTVRGCENASAVGTANLTNPFPTAAQRTDATANWCKSSTANTTARPFDIWVSNRWIIFAPVIGTGIVDPMFFGDTGTALPADGYATMCTVRGNTTVSSAQGLLQSGNSAATTAPAKPVYFDRSYDGTVLSSTGYWRGPMTGSSMGLQLGMPAMLAGPTAKIDMCPIPITDLASGTSGKAIAVRAFIPNMWQSLGNGPGSVVNRDTFTDTAYGASAAFQAVICSNDSSSCLVQTTDDWVVPTP